MLYNIGDQFKIRKPSLPYQSSLKYELVQISYKMNVRYPYIVECEGDKYSMTEKQITKNLEKIGE